MEAFSEIFEALIQDHGSRPRHYGSLPEARFQAEGINPLTGDRFTVFIETGSDDLVTKASFTGRGSALALASASIMVSSLRGLSRAAALELVRTTLRRIEGQEPAPSELPESEWSHLLEVRHFPHRIACAALPWKTALKALDPAKRIN